jgi:hypothetical protein
MAEDTKTVIVLANGSIRTDEDTAENLAKRFSESSPSDFIEIEDTKGVTHWVAAGRVIAFHERDDKSPPAHL